MKKTRLFTVDVLGATYTVYADWKENENPLLKNCDGYIAPELKEIVLAKNNKSIHQSHVLTHELVHAFLYESGLDTETWSNNEEIVDWIALQVFKISSLAKDSIKKLKPFYTKTKKDKEVNSDGRAN